MNGPSGEAALVRRNEELERRVGELEAELRTARRALEENEAKYRESERRFRLTFERAAVGMAHVAPDGRWLRVNGKLCEILGYGRVELLSLTFADVTHPRDLEADLGCVRRMLRAEIRSYSKDKRYIRKDGLRAWVCLSVSLVRSPSGEPDYFTGLVEDISRRQLAELLPDPLAGRELEVLRLVAEGKTNARIAADLSYSEAMVKLHVWRVLVKLPGRNDRTTNVILSNHRRDPSATIGDGTRKRDG